MKQHIARQLVMAGILLSGPALMRASAVDVPPDFNKTPWTDGALFESFSNRPAWTGSDTGAALVTNQFTQPSTRFWTSEAGYSTGGQLEFYTALTNPANANFSAMNPVWVDMLIKFTLADSAPSDEEADGSLLLTYVTAESNLVVAVKNGATVTNTAQTIDPNQFYRLTIKLQDLTNYVVSINDIDWVTVPAAAAGAAGQYRSDMRAVVLSGFGTVDDLYIGHGDPKRTSATVANLAPATTKPEGWKDADLHAVNNWAANHSDGAPGEGQTLAADVAGKYFLVGADVKYADGTPVDPKIDLLMNDFDIGTGDKTIEGTVFLKVNDAVKDGRINGKIRLYGAKTYEDSLAPISEAGKWDAIATSDTVLMPAFTNGYTAKFSFDVGQEGGATPYKFFKPVIVSE